MKAREVAIDRDIEREVQGIVQYLQERRDREARMGQTFHDRPALAIELDSILEDLNRANKRLDALTSHFAMGRLDQFSDIEEKVVKARGAAMDAWVNAWCAKQELVVQHPQRTRSLDLQRAAVNLSVACFDRLGRGIASKQAKRIMHLAGLHEPDASSITKWMKEFRGEISRPARGDSSDE